MFPSQEFLTCSALHKAERIKHLGFFFGIISKLFILKFYFTVEYFTHMLCNLSLWCAWPRYPSGPSSLKKKKTKIFVQKSKLINYSRCILALRTNFAKTLTKISGTDIYHSGLFLHRRVKVLDSSLGKTASFVTRGVFVPWFNSICRYTISFLKLTAYIYIFSCLCP